MLYISDIKDRNYIYKYRIDDLTWFHTNSDKISNILNNYILDDIVKIIILYIKPKNYFIININE